MSIRIKSLRNISITLMTQKYVQKEETMTFSAELKEEIGNVFDNARHCRIAELAGILSFDGKIEYENGSRKISVSSENMIPAEKCRRLIKKIFHCDHRIDITRSNRNLELYEINFVEGISEEAFEALKIKQEKEVLIPDIQRLTNKNCCKRAFLRGAFISAGSISDPDRFYHLEIPCKYEYVAKCIIKIMNDLHLDAKMVERQRRFVVYLKHGTQISELLGLMGARTSLLNMENARIRREVRGNINRRVNCETANINKTAKASARQIEDILYIDEHIGLSSLPDGLDKMAKVRLQYPEANLSELGSHLEPPVGKSGVNHRLRKISAVAASLKNQGGSYYDKETGNYSDF